MHLMPFSQSVGRKEKDKYIESRSLDFFPNYISKEHCNSFTICVCYSGDFTVGNFVVRPKTLSLSSGSAGVWRKTRDRSFSFTAASLFVYFLCIFVEWKVALSSCWLLFEEKWNWWCAVCSCWSRWWVWRRKLIIHNCTLNHLLNT